MQHGDTRKDEIISAKDTEIQAKDAQL
eukprot:COSAG02_NODE_61009_length_269_cov_1.523529_1_plen_26_part_10